MFASKTIGYIKAVLTGLFFFYIFFTSMIAYSDWDVVAIFVFGLYAFVCGMFWQMDVRR